MAIRGLDLPPRMGEAEVSEVPRGEGLEMAGWGKPWRGDFKRDFKAPRHERNRRCAPVAYEPTLAWASSNANTSWRQRAGAMGGGMDASFR